MCLSQHSYVQSFVYCVYCKPTLIARVHSERMLLLGERGREGGRKERKNFSETKNEYVLLVTKISNSYFSLMGSNDVSGQKV